MSDQYEVQALEVISNEVDEFQINIIFATQYIKARTFLLKKLRKQSEQRKQTCNFIHSGNLKLETEIKNAEQNIKSSITALDIIKFANIELKKELLLSREKKLEIIERVNTGIIKYEGIWEKSKTKYENIPFVKNFLQTKNESLNLRENINILIEDSQKLTFEINKKKVEMANLDRKRVLELAEYFVKEKPRTLLAIIHKTDKINELNAYIKANIKDHTVNIASTSKINFEVNKEFSYKIHERMNVMENSWLNLNRNNTVTGLPKLQLCDIDLDALTAKLDQIKRDDLLNPIITKREETIPMPDSGNKRFKPDDINYDVKVVDDIVTGQSKTKNYSGKKLIHILDDIKLDKLQSYNLIAKVKPGELQDINTIKAVATTSVQDDVCKLQDNKPGEILEQDHIEENDLTINHSGVLVPPTQFLDLKECAEEVNEGNMPVGTKTHDSLNIMNTQENKPEEDRANEAMDNQINVSVASDESFNKMKDIILKQHNLDLSPQFIYSKKQMLNVNHEERVVTSKFFDKSQSEIKHNDNKLELSEKETSHKDTILTEKDYLRTETKEMPKELFVNLHDNKANSPVAEVNKNIETDKIEKKMSVSGFLFNHGPGGGIPESLDVSMSTSGYEENDADYLQCIDSSLLLSPKADLPETDENNVQVLSQDIPNFLSGLRKTGFSFFGSTTNSSDNKSDGKNNNNNFNFTFGGGNEENKKRGGLFSMFH